MSLHTSDDVFVKKIMQKDKELRQRMEAAQGESEEMYKLFKETLDNYTAAEIMPIKPLTRVLVV
ncbi:MAG: hypothetical protein JO327_01855 [Nitrososphaeraceae archaeon]|nr:hypothetical protein [Nitrososphaeraceae archaeon]MBV9666854.1 hypothetical protein [Nitrososphaeraceae archaeon]